MAETPLHEQQAQAYLRLAHRQLAMAEALLDKELSLASSRQDAKDTLARTRAMVAKIEALLA